MLIQNFKIALASQGMFILERRYPLSSRYPKRTKISRKSYLILIFFVLQKWSDRHGTLHQLRDSRLQLYTQNVRGIRSGRVLYASAIKLPEEPPDSRCYCRGFKKYNGRWLVSRRGRRAKDRRDWERLSVARGFTHHRDYATSLFHPLESFILSRTVKSHRACELQIPLIKRKGENNAPQRTAGSTFSLYYT